MGFLSSCDGYLVVPLKVRRESQGSTQVGSGESGLLSNCEGHLGIPFEWLQGYKASS